MKLTKSQSLVLDRLHNGWILEQRESGQWYCYNPASAKTYSTSTTFYEEYSFPQWHATLKPLLNKGLIAEHGNEMRLTQ